MVEMGVISMEDAWREGTLLTTYEAIREVMFSSFLGERGHR